ncbi:MAG: sigma-70 family RNA polymerase sigma factor [Oscillospiraceae bacterium]|jgi:RNA polymerase sigma-70 factor (ECF subfamily)|nr:sigma-70 family RNA polymerase sigma factor [Oscillospiraceae bacterium]
MKSDPLTAEEELQVVRKVLDGDKNAFEALVLENQKNVYNLALKMVGGEEDALDISQEAFLKAYSRLESFRGESLFSVWLYRITYNLCIDFLRKRRRTAASSLTYLDDEDDSIDIEIPDMRSNPEDSAIQRETKKIISDSINELGQIHREILIMREITGMSYTDIASVLNIGEGTVKSRLARARKNLADILVEKGTFPEGFRQKGQDRQGGDGAW